MAGKARRAVYADIEVLPENKVGEIIDGELFVSPRPALPHAHAASVIGAVLGSRFHGPKNGPDFGGGWWILDEPELHFGTDVLVPDIGAWRRERLPSLPNAPALTIVPDWVCEVISPSTGRLDRTRKMPLYAREGLQHLWLVDPLLRTLEVYRLEAGQWLVTATYGGDDVASVEPFAAVELRLARWWPD